LTLDRKTRRLQGQAPTRRASHEDTLLVEETAGSRSRPTGHRWPRPTPRGCAPLRLLPLHLVKDHARGPQAAGKRLLHPIETVPA
jgi:hypothetical protein